MLIIMHARELFNCTCFFTRCARFSYILAHCCPQDSFSPDSGRGSDIRAHNSHPTGLGVVPRNSGPCSRSEIMVHGVLVETLLGRHRSHKHQEQLQQQPSGHSATISVGKRSTKTTHPTHASHPDLQELHEVGREAACVACNQHFDTLFGGEKRKEAFRYEHIASWQPTLCSAPHPP